MENIKDKYQDELIFYSQLKDESYKLLIDTERQKISEYNIALRDYESIMNKYELIEAELIKALELQNSDEIEITRNLDNKERALKNQLKNITEEATSKKAELDTLQEYLNSRLQQLRKQHEEPISNSSLMSENEIIDRHKNLNKLIHNQEYKFTVTDIDNLKNEATIILNSIKALIENNSDNKKLKQLKQLQEQATTNVVYINYLSPLSKGGSRQKPLIKKKQRRLKKYTKKV